MREKIAPREFWNRRSQHYDEQSGAAYADAYRKTAECIRPYLTPNDRVLDFACGTGGFLVCALEHLRKQVRNIDDEAQLQNSILGVEKKPLPHMLCTTNLILHNIDNPQIKHDVQTESDRQSGTCSSRRLFIR